MEDKLDILLELTKENNLILRRIASYLYGAKADAKDFIINYIANILANYKQMQSIMPSYIRPYQYYILTLFKKKVVKKFGQFKKYSYLCIRKFKKTIK